MLNMDAICFKASVYFLPICFSGLVGVGCRRSWISYAATCIVTSSDDIIGKGMLSEKKYFVLENLYTAVLMVYEVIHR